MRIRIAATMLVALAALLIGQAKAAPPQAPEVPLSWQFDFHHDRLQAIEVVLPGEDKPKVFWYMRYTVTNRTGEDRMYVPEFLLYTETGQVLRAGQNTPTAVFDAIKKVYNQPLLTDMIGVTGKLLQGEDNARDGLAIWQDFDASSGAVTIFAGGLSGDTVKVELPQPIEVTEKDFRGKDRTLTKSAIVLTRTLEMVYKISGEVAARLHAPTKLAKETWVMR
jgi:hypothetical protein